MELCPTLDMIGYYFAKALQRYQFRCFHNIILGIHENEITPYNASGIALIEEIKIELERDKEEDNKE